MSEYPKELMAFAVAVFAGAVIAICGLSILMKVLHSI
jgi:hypothetical protein